MMITHKHIDEIFEYDGSQIDPSWAFQEFGIYGSSIITWIGPVNITPDNLKDFADVGLEIKSNYMVNFICEFFDQQPPNMRIALNLEDKGTPNDVETIGLYDIKVDEKQVFNQDNLSELINKTVTRFIDEIETIENDISKTKVLG